VYFFRDCEEFEIDNSNKKKYCKTYKNTLFPDWDSYFQSYTNHNIDFIFEYIFKPTKFISILLNISILLFRWWPLSIIPPYLTLFVLLLLYITLYEPINIYGKKIISFYTTFLSTFSIPFVKLFNSIDIASILQVPEEQAGWIGYYEVALVITFIFFVGTFFKDIFGFNWHEHIQKIINMQNDETECDISHLAEETFSKETDSWGYPILKLFMSNFFITGLIRIILCVLYFLIKFGISYLVIPLSLFIGVFYSAYYLFLPIYNNTTTKSGYFDKIELIHQFIYTDLYDVELDDNNIHYDIFSSFYKTIIYLLKTFCWIIMVFMKELLSIYILYQGLNQIIKSFGNGNQDDNGNGEAIKLVLVTVYIFIFILIGLWCCYKYKFKLPLLELFYSKRKDSIYFDVFTEENRTKFDKFKNGDLLNDRDPDTYTKFSFFFEEDDEGQVKFNSQKYNKYKYWYEKIMKTKNSPDKRVYKPKDIDAADTYLKFHKNNPLSILFGSDLLNKKIMCDNKNNKTSEKSYMNDWSGKIFESLGNLGDNLFQKGRKFMEPVTSNIKKVNFVETSKKLFNNVKQQVGNATNSLYNNGTNVKNSLSNKFGNKIQQLSSNFTDIKEKIFTSTII
jgi:hypothetical protein